MRMISNYTMSSKMVDTQDSYHEWILKKLKEERENGINPRSSQGDSSRE
jgi:translation elongation factor EF-1alpha